MWKSILKTATFKQSQITVFGTILNGFLGALFFILIARFLGPANFGILTVSIATLTLIADIVDFGTNTGIVRFVSSNLAINENKAFKFLKLGLEVKLMVWALVLLTGFFLAPLVAEKIFIKAELTLPLRLGLFGVGGALLFSFAASSLQALQKYLAWSFINIVTNFLRLCLVLMLIFYQQLGLVNSLIVYIALPFLGFFLALLLLPTRTLLKVTNEYEVAGEFFNYNRWVAIFTIIAAISSRLDIFLNTKLLSVTEVGIYGAASQLVQIVPQLNGALGVVAAPKFASFQKKRQMLTYFKKFQWMVLGLAGLGSLVMPLSFYAIPIIYGQQYGTTVIPFIVLLLAMLIFLLSLPLHTSIIYYFGKPQVFVWVSIGHFSIIAILGYFLILSYGIVGAAIAVLIGMLFNLLVPLFWFLVKLREKGER